MRKKTRIIKIVPFVLIAVLIVGGIIAVSVLNDYQDYGVIILKKHAEILDDKSRAFFQAYIDGVNQYVEKMKDEHHVEFSQAGISPSK